MGAIEMHICVGDNLILLEKQMILKMRKRTFCLVRHQSAQSDQCLSYPHKENCILSNTKGASDDSDQTARMRSLI